MLFPSKYVFLLGLMLMLADVLFTRGVEADGLQHLQWAPVGYSLTACLYEGLVMRATVFILSAFVRMTRTLLCLEPANCFL